MVSCGANGMIKTLNIGILMQADDNWMGGIIYIKNLVKSIAELPANKREHIKLYLFIGSNLKKSYYEELENLVEQIYITNCIKPSFLNRLLWKVGQSSTWLKDTRLIKLLESKEIDFVYPVPINWGISWDFNCGWSTWIPDFQHKYLPSYFSTKEIKSRDKAFKYLSNNSLNIVFSSKSALSDFAAFYPESKAQKFVLSFRTIPNQDWFDNHLAPTLVQEKYNLPNKFFLVSNQFWIHKNHKLIIEALILLKRTNVKPVVVCTGKLYDSRFPKYGEEIKNSIEKNCLSDQFIILGLIPRWDQIQLMRRSLAVIQPSLFEGWSTVVEDARVLGKTILLSDISVHKEQNSPGAIFFKPDSSQELANHLELLTTKLMPGPDLISESEAQTNNKIECQTYAEQFLNIVQTVVS